MQQVKRLAVLTSLTAPRSGSDSPAIAVRSREPISPSSTYARRYIPASRASRAAADRPPTAHRCGLS